MTRMMNKTLLAAALLTLPLSFAAAQPAPERNPTGPAHPLEYAVKFICGRSATPNAVSGSVPLGNYSTVVNVHNPGKSMEFTYKVALAGFATAGRMTPFQPALGLKYDEVLDIDCQWIARRLDLSGIPMPAFRTGFLVIQSPRELDVVAVYAAAPTTTNQVASIHTERVAVRRVN